MRQREREEEEEAEAERKLHDPSEARTAEDSLRLIIHQREELFGDSARPDELYKFIASLPRKARRPGDLVAQVLSLCARLNPEDGADVHGLPTPGSHALLGDEKDYRACRQDAD